MRILTTAIMASALLAGSVAQATPSNYPPQPKLVSVDIQNLVPLPEAPDFDKEVLAPLRKEQAVAAAKAAQEAEAARVAKEAEDARIAAEKALGQAAPKQSSFYTVATFGGELVGSFGYALPYGNCVLEFGVNNPGWGNPIDWPVLSQEPTIGASVLFYFNHVAVVTGIWSNGDIEVRHQNVTGGQTRYPRSMIRGFR